MTRTHPGAGDDAAVIEVSLRDPDRFALIFDRHAPPIHRYLARRLGRGAADDLVGETFLIAFGKRGSYDTTRPDARPWLYGIATHLVGQYRRDEVRDRRLVRAAVPQPDQHCHADGVAARVSAQAMGAALAGALAGLSPGDRDVLLLVAWEALSYEEVATALAIPVGTVRSRLHRARSKVRAALSAPAPSTVPREATHHG